MLKLLIEAGHIAALIEGDFSPSADTVLIDPPVEFAPEQAEDWAWNGTALVRDPVLVLTRIKAQRLNELAALRYSKETAGVNLNGMAIATDRESQALITGAWSYSQLNPNVLIDWKAATGWIQIDAATISVIAAVVAGHVQACFSNERALSAAIDSATTIEELNAIDLNDGWAN